MDEPKEYKVIKKLKYDVIKKFVKTIGDNDEKGSLAVAQGVKLHFVGVHEVA